MNSHLPPVPSENRSPKGPGEPPNVVHRGDDGMSADMSLNPDKKGHAGNTKVNTTHQGYQQDR
jgi:hypothetical protein